MMICVITTRQDDDAEVVKMIMLLFLEITTHNGCSGTPGKVQLNVEVKKSSRLTTSQGGVVRRRSCYHSS